MPPGGEVLEKLTVCETVTIYSHSVKVKVTLVQTLRLCTGRTAHRRSRRIALLFLDHGTRRGWRATSRPGQSLLPGKTRYPLYRRLGGPQGRSGQVQKISPPPGFDPRTVQSGSSVVIPTEPPDSPHIQCITIKMVTASCNINKIELFLG